MFIVAAAAAWRFERGVSVLSVEYLLGGRTVFGAITTPPSLCSINLLAPLLFVLWALLPLRAQAALKVI